MCLSRPTYLRDGSPTEAKIEENPAGDACYLKEGLTKRQLRWPSTNSSDHTLASVTSRRNQTKTARKDFLLHQLCGSSQLQNYRCRLSISRLSMNEGPLRQTLTEDFFLLDSEDEDSEDEDTTRRVNGVSEDEDMEDEPDEYDAQKCIMQPVFITWSPSSTKLAL
jgi:hypothetical protein